MARTADAIINPDLLVWARRSAGYEVEEAALKLKTDPQTLMGWETGAVKPTVAKLRDAAELYKRPLAIFYLPEPPMDFQPLRDFRRRPDGQVGRQSPRLLAAVRRAQDIRDVALELRGFEDDPPGPSPHIDASGRDSEAFAAAARALLPVPLDRQFGWENARTALNGWIDAVTSIDVLVLQVQAIDVHEMRGFSMSADTLPLITLNGGDFPRGRIFTLLHEFAHVLLHATGVCDALPRTRPEGPTDEIEVFCNRVAAAILMPEGVFDQEAALRNVPRDGRWDQAVLDRLSYRYSVSREAVVRRLFGLGLTDWSFVQEKQAEYQAAFEAWKAEQAQKRREDERAGGPSFYRMKVRDLGRPFIESVVDAYHRRVITGSDLSEFLEVKLNQLPSLQAELALTGGQRD